MSFTLEDFNGMELMWEQFQNRKQGSHIRLSAAEVDEMWNCGIIDTARFSIAQWRAAFDQHRQPDGSYLVTKEEFLDKEKYRYKGEIMVPFDAMLINEGKYTDEGLKELVDESIAPSCSLSISELNKFIEGLKNEFRDRETNLIKIESPAKIKIKNLILAHPSPLRRLELIFDYMLSNLEKDSTFLQTNAGDITARQLIKIQMSSFSMSALNIGEEKFKALSKIEKRAQKKEELVETKPSTELKKIKRSRKGFRG